MDQPLKIATVASEIDPFSKAGGLADVARSLPKALKKLGHDVIAITPLYGTIDKEKFRLKKIFKDISLDIYGKSYSIDIWRDEFLKELPVYFIDHKEFFSSQKCIYGAENDNERFLLFDLAVLKLLHILHFEADIIHLHDWQTGLIPYFLRKEEGSSFLKNTATVFTIHNLVFQMGSNWWQIPNKKKDNGREELLSFIKKQGIKYINFAKRGILYADIVNTVSEQYAKEALTRKFGEDLYGILRNKNKKDQFFGIIDGIDYNDYNPNTDPGLVEKYSVNSLEEKLKNKLFLQDEFNLPVNPDIPLLGMATRITEQKGFDLLQEIIIPLLRIDLQLVILGGGEKQYEDFFSEVAKKHPKKISGHFKFVDTKKTTQLYAGTDMFLMLSRFEPCGMGQLISLRYGSVPIVRATGGLVDTITDFNPKTGYGNGFIFKQYDSRNLLVAIVRALETYKYKEAWKQLVKNGMRQSFSWEIPARKYITLFHRALAAREEEKKKM